MKETVSSSEEKQHNIGFLTFKMPLIFFICEGCFLILKMVINMMIPLSVSFNVE